MQPEDDLQVLLFGDGHLVLGHGLEHILRPHAHRRDDARTGHRFLARDRARRGGRRSPPGGGAVGLLARSESELSGSGRASWPAGAIPLPADVGDREQVRAAVERFIETAGGLDLVVANAGIAALRPVSGPGRRAVEAMTRINWLGTIYTVDAALGHLIDRASGHIVVVSSGAGLRSFPWAAGYGATKARPARRSPRRCGTSSAAPASRSRPSTPARSPRTCTTTRRRRCPTGTTATTRRPASTGCVAAILRGVEQDRRAVHHPPIIRLLGLDGIAPRLTDAILRRLRGGTAAPRRD